MNLRLRSLFLAGLAVMATATLAVRAQVPGINSSLNAVYMLAYDQSTMKPTYSASASWVPAAGATDVCSLSGSATTTVKVRRVIFGGVASAVQSQPVALLKRSTAYTTGNGFQPQVVPYDSTNSLTSSTSNAGTAVMEAWTTDPTVGTLVGLIADLYHQWGNLTTGLGSTLTFTLGQLGSPVVLRGVAQQLAVNLNAVNYTTPTISCTFEWTEE